MKRFLTLAMAFSLIATVANAKIWRLNNNNTYTPVVQVDFLTNVTLQQAHDSAKVQSGDTIHIEQSPTNYGGCTFTKRLTVIGAGYFLNDNPNTQVNRNQSSLVSNLIFNNPGAAGSVVMGLTLNNAEYLQVSVNNMVVRHNWIGTVYIGSGNANTVNNTLIAQNIINGSQSGIGIQTVGGTTGKTTDVKIYGNIIVAGAVSTAWYAINLSANTSGIIKNNLLYSYYHIFNVSNFYMVNNLAYNGVGVSFSPFFNNCVLEYNLGNHAGVFATPVNQTNTVVGNGNITAANFLFVGATPNIDKDWQLQAGSPAKNVGKGGIDIGPYAGDFPYRLSGIPAVPNIYNITISPIPAGASTMSVSVTAKSNN
jgi:hypothetical protein